MRVSPETRDGATRIDDARRIEREDLQEKPGEGVDSLSALSLTDTDG